MILGYFPGPGRRLVGPPAEPTAETPQIGDEWAGGGFTVRIVEVWGDGCSVRRLTGRGRRLKRPSGRAFMVARAFEDGTMRLVKREAPGV